ncbi:hypothetical protein BDR26DRAFT_932065 [Obelidium mucronatum]|nr:hypothetical protein BDR26DRAFT_932065 [Obelidium mucronatum]
MDDDDFDLGDFGAATAADDGGARTRRAARRPDGGGQAARAARAAEARAQRREGERRGGSQCYFVLCCVSAYSSIVYRLSKTKEQSALFDEVSEEVYQKYIRKKIEEDDFVVDDDGKGYADYGYDFDKDDEEGSESESEAEEDGFAKRRMKKNDKSKKQKKVAKEARVTTFFSKQAAKNAAASSSTGATDDSTDASIQKPRVVKKKEIAVVNEEDLLNDIFGEMDNPSTSVAAMDTADNNDFHNVDDDADADDFDFVADTGSREPLVFKFDGIIGDFHASRDKGDLFTNSFEKMLSDNDEDMNANDDQATRHIL